MSKVKMTKTDFLTIGISSQRDLDFYAESINKMRALNSLKPVEFEPYPIETKPDDDTKNFLRKTNEEVLNSPFSTEQQKAEALANLSKIDGLESTAPAPQPESQISEADVQNYINSKFK